MDDAARARAAEEAGDQRAAEEIVADRPATKLFERHLVEPWLRQGEVV